MRFENPVLSRLCELMCVCVCKTLDTEVSFGVNVFIHLSVSSPRSSNVRLSRLCRPEASVHHRAAADPGSTTATLKPSFIRQQSRRIRQRLGSWTDGALSNLRKTTWRSRSPSPFFSSVCVHTPVSMSQDFSSSSSSFCLFCSFECLYDVSEWRLQWRQIRSRCSFLSKCPRCCILKVTLWILYKSHQNVTKDVWFLFKTNTNERRMKRTSCLLTHNSVVFNSVLFTISDSTSSRGVVSVSTR